MVKGYLQRPSQYNYLMGLLYNVDDGVMENLPPDVLTRGLEMLSGMKSSVYDPDTPTYRQEMIGEHK